MGKPYSQDLRERVIAGTRVCAAARLFWVSVSYVSKVVGRRRASGETTARVGRAGRKPKLAAHDEALRARVAAYPDATLEELQAWLLAEREVKVSIGCLWNRLKFLKLPLKKSRSEPPSAMGRQQNDGSRRYPAVVRCSMHSEQRMGVVHSNASANGWINPLDHHCGCPQVAVAIHTLPPIS
jgi:transposase